MECTTRTTGSLSIVEIAGAVDSRSAGQLYDVLVDIVRDSQSKLIVDLSKVQSMTRAGVRGLVVAAKLLMPGRDKMRICGANRTTEDMLRGLGLDHLLNIDPTLEASLAILFPQVNGPGVFSSAGRPAGMPADRPAQTTKTDARNTGTPATAVFW
ncbi:STAS domain-containing protein [Hoeflea sp. WL0058]|uniref:STAS domain-containing protein n=1 Tax=Flavimaribacter sediminis TaxID=2865987 RepID=A0AAE2ZQI8_9HYPH|nr:STAS domain-containing protein [Flavimaribacter sediminis]MBW8640184.1 STAS domain-containing protein [Flavimaribacter sediminis]